ncbi:MAG TPA: hypothetical protein VGW75_11940 [Solirubrobacteraceae bacterium]|jgi:hypothetical protein|nr:hypothetical protein [Solirubrobacteraceae bacterium]
MGARRGALGLTTLLASALLATVCATARTARCRSSGCASSGAPAAEHGLDRRAVDALINRALEPRGEQHPAPDELTEQASTFTPRDVLQALAAAQADGASVI